jgi:hypothetical protein
MRWERLAMILKPKRNGGALIIEEMGAELVIFDRSSDAAHCLDRLATVVWHQCDGKKSVSQIACDVRREIDDASEAEVLSVLAVLEEHELITDCERTRAAVSRRSALKRVGTIAAASAAITTILAPTAAQAVSGGDEFTDLPPFTT